MPANLLRAARPFALAAAVAGTGALAARHYRALPAVLSPGAPTSGEPLPFVSIVVPARNEAHNLPTLLPSLLALDYPDYEILVVDDASTDGTAAIAASLAARSGGRLRVVPGADPRPGWTGKNAACDLGARVAAGEWLLFTDADTAHSPASLRAAMRTAQAAGARALSLFPRQRCHTFWERLLLPFAYQQYFTGVRPRALRRPGGPALANGQYMLVARDVYDACSGHAAVAASITEDVALAAALKRAGFPVLMCRGEQFVAVRMYDGLGMLAEGFTKSSSQFLRSQGHSGALVAAGTACAAGILPALAGALLRRDLGAVTGALAAYAAQTLALATWLRDFGVPRRYALLGPLAALTFTGIALSSALRTLTRRPVRWKGRSYLRSGVAPVRAPTRQASHAR